MNNRAATLGTLALAVGFAGGATGCGWTPRDEFHLNRSLTLKAKPGDGSEVSYKWNAQESLAARRVGAEVAAANAGPQR